MNTLPDDLIQKLNSQSTSTQIDAALEAVAVAAPDPITLDKCELHPIVKPAAGVN